jgi:uncharacterized membrane protein YhaH (DUF805 family)
LADSKTFFWFFFKLRGRVGRAAYFLGFLFMMIAVSFPLYQFMRFPEEAPAAQAWSLVFGIAFFAALWSHVAMTVKRFHDLGRTGFMSLSLFIPVISIIAFIYLCVTPGTAGPNLYGRLADSPD